MTETGTTLREKARTALLERPKTIKASDVADEIGVSVAWVNSFTRGEINNPGVVTIEKLLAFLKKKTNKAAN